MTNDVTTSPRLPTRAEAIEGAAQALVDGIAARDALSPRDAAKAAGARTEADIEKLAARIAADRREGGEAPAP